MKNTSDLGYYLLMSMMAGPGTGYTPISKSIKEENKKLHSETIDVDAARRQAINSLSNAMMTLQFLKDSGVINPSHMESFNDAFADLTKSRFLLVEHADPDNALDELAQL